MAQSESINLKGTADVWIEIAPGLNNAVPYGITLWNPTTKTWGPTTSGHVDISDNPLPRYNLGKPTVLKRNRLVVSFRLALTSIADGNSYVVSATFFQSGGKIGVVDYTTTDAAQQGVYNELHANFT
jgi:hypothetical protein